MGRKKEKGLLPQVTAVSWQVRLPGGEKKERGRILTGILFLAAVFGCTLSVLEMLEPPVDKKVFLGGIFFLAVIWQIICWNKKTCAWGQNDSVGQCDSVCHFPLGQDPDRGKNGGKYSA